LAEQQTVDLGELALRLTAFARRTFADFGLRGADTAVAGVGLSIEDFAWKVLEEYVEGKLEHEASRGDLFSLLATALRNDIIDSLRKAAHVHEQNRSSLPRESDSAADPPSLDEMPSAAIDVAALLDEENYRKRVWASLAGEPELTEVVTAIMDLNLYTPREIAAALGISAT
jgi:DNA-directed RNA polymerase specialized sigma24 family protein